MADNQKEKLHIFSTGRTDITLLFVVIFLMVFGIIMVYSSSYYFSLETFGTNTYFFVRQSVWVVMGLVVMYVVSRINHKIFLRLAGLLYLVVLILLIAVLFTAEDINGSKRWLDLGFIKFQPSEIAKLAIILSFAVLLPAFEKHLSKFKVFLLLMFLACVPIGLVVIENLSTAVVLVAIFGGMMIVVYPSTWKLLLMTLPPLGLGAYAMTHIDKFKYRFDRIQIWLDGPFSDPTGKGFQTIQSLYAIGAGGFFGVGLGKSIQKLEFIPEAHNDIIFSIICEELGLFGAFSILTLFCLLLWRLFDIIRQTGDLESMLIVVGVMMHIGAQLFVNVGVVTNAIPATGIPLPFVSYGGSSLLFLLVEIGIVLNVARTTNHRLESRDEDA